MKGVMRAGVAGLVLLGCLGQEGPAALAAFQEWRKSGANERLEWDAALRAYEGKLKSEGKTAAEAERTLRLVTAYDEAELYDRVYAEPPRFNAKPNGFLVEAVKGLKPGRALDVGMGQGRNAVYLAGLGWRVTGFDVSAVGLKKARTRAAEAGVALEAVRAADEEFDFGRERWDLIVILHALEKRSVHRVRAALKPGGVVVVEAAHAEPGGYPFGYTTAELRQVFEGFTVLRCEERVDVHDFSESRDEKSPLVRWMARKPR